MTQIIPSSTSTRLLASLVALSLAACTTAQPAVEATFDAAGALARCKATTAAPPAPATVTFRNSGQDMRRVYWVNADGDLHLYGEVAPGRSLEQNTYVGHLWVVKASDGRIAAQYCASHPIGEQEVGT